MGRAASELEASIPKTLPRLSSGILICSDENNGICIAIRKSPRNNILLDITAIINKGEIGFVNGIISINDSAIAKSLIIPKNFVDNIFPNLKTEIAIAPITMPIKNEE